jgi:hypothetical protein
VPLSATLPPFTANVAVRPVAPDGVMVTVKLHELLAATDAPQVFEPITKSLAFVPEIVGVASDPAVLPVF